jgi:hypothetical protein
MSTVVSIMDRDNWSERTDNIAVVEPHKKRILFIPRDLWCDTLQNRINTAFRTGGHELLLACLNEHKIQVDSSICLRRAATIDGLKDIQIYVPIRKVMKFWYPLYPTRPIEDGRKSIVFTPPGELLSGERIHQWMGARYTIDEGNSDIRRLDRHITLLHSLLEQNFDFTRLVANEEHFSTYGSSVFEDLRQVRAGWKLEVLEPVEHKKIGKRLVVIRKSRFHPKYVLQKIISRFTDLLNLN